MLSVTGLGLNATQKTAINFFTNRFSNAKVFCRQLKKTYSLYFL